MTPNASAVVGEFVRSATGTGNLRRTYTETNGTATRCRVTPAAATNEVLALGETTGELYHCAIAYSKQPLVGWQVALTLDGETTARNCTVRASRKRFGHWHLLLERA